ncbi:hypothetical protein HYC85_006786 [Camellia sinensis]|uniref:Uncharacterized protein n=1 Tax=Camellia sinensis TaxID=4442 RepID=A0A7J7HM31_CAMSI|nr:hypothetical protein HYC85_006786 [Camellia sinensis]
MATRVARAADSASSLIGIVGRGCVSKIRWASSSSEASPKPNKKITDRLSGVIDAVNDRKLPPDLRGQRNAVRSETDITILLSKEYGIPWKKGSLRIYRGKANPLTSILILMLTQLKIPCTEFFQGINVHRSGLS